MSRREDEAVWQAALQSGDLRRIADTALALTRKHSRVDTDFRFTVTDYMWRPVGEIGTDLIRGSGTDPRNECPSARLEMKGTSDLVPVFMNCRNTMVGVIVETGGGRYPFYVTNHRYTYRQSSWTSHIELKGIWSILDYLYIWPTWWLPIQTQPFSHAVFLWGLQTVLESMVAECAMRIQTGIWEAINNGLSLNPDIQAWFGTMLQALKRDGLSIDAFRRMLRTPIYVSRTNPFLDTSPLAGRTVRMESCGAVIRDITRAYGVDARMDLWLPGDPQPDWFTQNVPGMALDQPTYVFSTRDRSQVEGPTKTVFDSVLRTVVDLGGSFGLVIPGLIQQIPGMDGVYESPALGVNHEPPYAIVVAPDAGEDSSIIEAEITDHTPEGWQFIIGGRSPKWLNDLLNALFSWLIDSLMIIVGFTGFPSDLLSGFLNNAFFAFQLVQVYRWRDEMGPYHPHIERFYPTQSAPYNIEATFAFINAIFDARGYTSAQVTFRNGDSYALNRDIWRGGLMSLVYYNRTRMLTDYVENVMWSVSDKERTVTVQLGDGRRDEPPLAKHQRFITAVFEAINVWTLAPQS